MQTPVFKTSPQNSRNTTFSHSGQYIKHEIIYFFSSGRNGKTNKPWAESLCLLAGTTLWCTVHLLRAIPSGRHSTPAGLLSSTDQQWQICTENNKGGINVTTLFPVFFPQPLARQHHWTISFESSTNRTNTRFTTGFGFNLYSLPGGLQWTPEKCFKIKSQGRFYRQASHCLNGSYIYYPVCIFFEVFWVFHCSQCCKK